MNQRSTIHNEILGIDNVFFQVGDLDKAIAFYEKLGFVLKFKLMHMPAAVFMIGKEEPGLMLFEKKDPAPTRLWVEVTSALKIQSKLKHGSIIETATGLTFEIVDPWNNCVGFADYSKKPELARFSHNYDIRPMTEQDIAKIVHDFTFPWSTPEKTKTMWETYCAEQEKGVRIAAIIEINNKIVGYGSFLRKSEYRQFADANIPEISAIWIHENYRKQGLGTALIKWMESAALQESYRTIGIGVGLYRDYGPAQKLYFRLGYIPDGNGVTYKYQTTIPGQAYPLDDDLILWLIKSLTHLEKKT